MKKAKELGRCLVTGGTGFVGKILLKELESLGLDLILLLRHKNKSCSAKQFLCDLSNQEISREAFVGVDTIFHLAAYTHDTRETEKVEHLYRELNVDATIRLISLAAEQNIKRFIFVSSIKAGGTATQGKCMSESDQREPEGIYGKTKREAELKILEIGKQSGMHVSIIRPSLVYGPNVKGNLGMMLKGIKNGWFPPFLSTFNMRSMVHVDDLVKAIILAAEKEEANGETFIVTDGEQYSSRDIFDEMCLAVGRKIPKWYVPRYIFQIFAKSGDVLGKFMRFPFSSYRYQKLLGDDCYSSDKIREELGFKSNMTLRDALPEMINYIDN